MLRGLLIIAGKKVTSEAMNAVCDAADLAKEHYRQAGNA